MRLTDFLKSINDTKKNVMDEDENVEKLYAPFVINRCMSFFPDTILYANEMNRNYELDNKLQYDYFLNSVRKRKRFSKWLKNESSDDLELIKYHFNYSDRKAKEVIDILGTEGIEKIRNLYGSSFNIKNP